MGFDPNQPFDVVSDKPLNRPKFDPNQPFEAVKSNIPEAPPLPAFPGREFKPEGLGSVAAEYPSANPHVYNFGADPFTDGIYQKGHDLLNNNENKEPLRMLASAAAEAAPVLPFGGLIGSALNTMRDGSIATHDFKPDQSYGNTIVRAASRNLLPAVAGTVAGTAASTAATPIAGIPAGIGFSTLVSHIQDKLKQPSQEDMIQREDDEKHRKWANIIGETLPGFATMKPDMRSLASSLGPRAVGATVGAAVPTAVDVLNGNPVDTDRVMMGAAMGATMTGNSIGEKLSNSLANTRLNRAYRGQVMGQKDAKAVMNDAIPVAEAPAAIAAIEKGEMNTPGINPMDAVGTSGAEKLRQAQTLRTDKGVLIQEADKQRARDLAQGLDTTLTQDAGKGQLSDAQTAIQQDQAAKMAMERKRIAYGEKTLAAAQGELDAEGKPIAMAKGDQNPASAKLAGHMTGALEGDTVKKNETYLLGEEGKKPVLDMSPLHDAAHTAFNKSHFYDDAPGKIRGILGEVSSKLSPKSDPVFSPDSTMVQNGLFITPEGEIGGSKANITYDDVAGLRPILSKAIANARVEGTGPVIDRLVKLKAAVESIVSQTSAGQKGNENFKENFAPKYGEGEGKNLRQAVKTNTLRPENVGDQFIPADTGSSPGQTTAQLRRILEAAKNPAEALKSARDFLVAKMGDYAVDSDGKVNVKNVQKFIDKHGEALKVFPEIGKEITQMRNQLQSKSDKVGQFQSFLEQYKQGAADRESALGSTPAGGFLTKDSHSAVESIMKSDNPAEAMKSAFDIASKDKTGKGVQGLQAAVKQWLNTSVRQATDIGLSNEAESPKMGNRALSHAEMQRLLTEPKSRAALDIAFSSEPNTMTALDTVNRQVQALTRVKNAGVGGQSATAGIMLDPKAPKNMIPEIMDTAEAVAPAKVGLVRRLWETVKGGYAGGYKQFSSDLQHKMVTDPETAKIMLRPVDAKNLPALTRIFRVLPGSMNPPTPTKDESQQ